MTRVAIMRLPEADPAVPLPDYATAGAAGADLRANLPPGERAGLTLAPGARRLVPLGFALALPEGCEMQLRPRSGRALGEGLTVANAPGTIDSDYRGAVGVILVNLGAEPVRIAHGERVAQGVIAPVLRAEFAETDRLEATARGAGGFGSTGRS